MVIFVLIKWHISGLVVVVVVDVTTLKIARKPVKLQKENAAGSDLLLSSVWCAFDLSQQIQSRRAYRIRVHSKCMIVAHRSQ